jgi:hypothetical protein
MNHPLVIEALAAQALVNWAEESKVKRESLSEVIRELLPTAEDFKDHSLNVTHIHVAICQTFLHLGVFCGTILLVNLPSSLV